MRERRRWARIGADFVIKYSQLPLRGSVPARPSSLPLTIALAGMFGVLPAHAQSPEIIKEQAGEWLAAADDGRPGCRIRLKTDKTVGGMVAAPAADCASRIPVLAKVEAWHMANGVTLSDASRKPILVFTEDETAILKTREGGPPTYYLVRSKPGVDRLPHASAIFGTWQMRRPKGPAICTVTFRDKPPKGGEESYALALDSNCDPAIRKLKLSSWKIEDISLMLYGEEDGLQFRQTASGYEKVIQGRDRPLELVRQP